MLSVFLAIVCASSITAQEEKENLVSESWMGVYMEGVKVGYSHERITSLSGGGEYLIKSLSESWMRISRLGGSPVEIESSQESLTREDDTPVKTVIRTKMSENEIVIEADVVEGKILFKTGEKSVREYPFSEKFYLGIPIKKIIDNGDLQPGKKLPFPILDPLSYAVRKSTFEVLALEDVLIVGKKMRLWHVRTELESIIPVVVDEWIDKEGTIWKSVSQASFMTTTSIRMPREKALEMSEKSLDIAYSTIIRSNVLLGDPLKITQVTFKLSGIPLEDIKNLPFDDGSQVLVESQNDFAIVRTTSQIFREKDSLSLPVKGKEFHDDLSATAFCQSDDPEIIRTARGIIGEEKNAWKAAKEIARWVEREMSANYDVGFATASEILKNREGDCSEHTVIFVALCRSVGIPARAAVGIMYADGIFAYHMWPEVYVGKWVNLDAKWLARDEETGEYYTDATHLKLGRSSLDEKIFEEMAAAVAGIIGKLKLEILDFESKD